MSFNNYAPLTQNISNLILFDISSERAKRRINQIQRRKAGLSETDSLKYETSTVQSSIPFNEETSVIILGQNATNVVNAINGGAYTITNAVSGVSGVNATVNKHVSASQITEDSNESEIHLNVSDLNSSLTTMDNKDNNNEIKSYTTRDSNFNSNSSNSSNLVYANMNCKANCKSFIHFNNNLRLKASLNTNALKCCTNSYLMALNSQHCCNDSSSDINSSSNMNTNMKSKKEFQYTVKDVIQEEDKCFNCNNNSNSNSNVNYGNDNDNNNNNNCNDSQHSIKLSNVNSLQYINNFRRKCCFSYQHFVHTKSDLHLHSKNVCSESISPFKNKLSLNLSRLNSPQHYISYKSRSPSYPKSVSKCKNVSNESKLFKDRKLKLKMKCSFKMKTNTTHNKHSFFDNNNNNNNNGNDANINEMRLLTEVSTRCAKWKSKCHSRSNTAFTSPNKFYKHSRVNSNVNSNSNSNSNGNGNQQKKEMERKCNTASKMCRQKKFRSGNAVNVSNKGSDNNSKKYNTISNRSKCNKGKSGFIILNGSNTSNTKITKTSLIYPSPSKHITSISFVTPTINTTIKQLCNNK